MSGINNKNCGDVVFRALDYIKQKKPKNFVLENVSGFATSGNGSLCQEIVEELKSLDAYSIFVEYLNAEDYGIPQSKGHSMPFLSFDHQNSTLPMQR